MDIINNLYKMRLDEINASAYQYQAAISNQFVTICKPLFDLGIFRFGYMKIFNNGSYLFND